jgi:hypothetical protein
MAKTLVNLDENLCNALASEMARVEALRMKLNPNDANDIFTEFMMRRALLRAKFALTQHNVPEALRMWKVLAHFGSSDGAQ